MIFSLILDNRITNWRYYDDIKKKLYLKLVNPFSGKRSPHLNRRIRPKVLFYKNLLSSWLMRYEYAYNLITDTTQKVPHEFPLLLDKRMVRRNKLRKKRFKYKNAVMLGEYKRDKRVYSSILKDAYKSYKHSLGQFGLSRINSKGQVKRSCTKTVLLIISIKDNCSFFFVF